MFFWIDRDDPLAKGRQSHRPWYIRVIAGYFALSGLWAWGSLCWFFIGKRYPVAPNAAIFAQVIVMAAIFFLAAYLFWLKSKFAALLVLLIPFAQLYGYSRLHPDEPGFFEYEPHIEYFRHAPPWLICAFVYHSGLAVVAVLLWKRRVLS